MERSAEERTKYPDRINLDRRGLHGIPLLADEPGLRLLRFPLSCKCPEKDKNKDKNKDKDGDKYRQGLCGIPLLTDEPDFRLLCSPTFFPLRGALSFRVFTPSD